MLVWSSAKTFQLYLRLNPAGRSQVDAKVRTARHRSGKAGAFVGQATAPYQPQPQMMSQANFSRTEINPPFQGGTMVLVVHQT
jgi:hypothetical protein